MDICDEESEEFKIEDQGKKTERDEEEILHEGESQKKNEKEEEKEEEEGEEREKKEEKEEEKEKESKIQLRKETSPLTMKGITPVELMEVQIVNSTVPFMLISSLSPLLKVFLFLFFQ